MLGQFFTSEEIRELKAFDEVYTLDPIGWEQTAKLAVGQMWAAGCTNVKPEHLIPVIPAEADMEQKTKEVWTAVEAKLKGGR